MLAHTVFLRSCSRNAKGIPFVGKNEQVCVRGILLDCVRIAPGISIWYERQEKRKECVLCVKGIAGGSSSY